MEIGVIEQFYKFLKHEKQSELRFIEPRWKNSNSKPIQEWANNLAQFNFLCKKYDGEYNLYVGINERKPRGDKDEDIDFITNIGHDIDAHDGNPDSFLKAQEVAIKIKDDCIDKGYEEPMIICSGRGFWVIHHIYPLENNAENIKRVKHFGKIIKEKYEVEGIELDSSVYNPSRIARIPGTLNISDEKNQIRSFIVNEPKGTEDFKLSEKIKDIELPKTNYISTGEQPKSSCAFMDYCLAHEIPEGERHKVISRNMSIYVQKHPDRELLREQYFKIQKGSETELDQWLKSLDENPDKEYPFSCGQLINFQRKYKIPSKCVGCPKFLEYKKEKKAEENLNKQIEHEEAEKELKTEGKFLFQAFNEFTNFLDTARTFIKTQPVYYDKFKIWWLWNKKDKRWEVVDEVDLLNAIDDYTNNPSTNSRIKNEILEALKRIGRRNKPLDAKKTWIQFKDLIIDIETGESFQADPKYFVTNPIPWKLGEDDSTPNMDRILIEWVGEKYLKTLKQIMAYCFLPSMPIHRIFCFIGDGLNGKGTYLRLIENLIGDDNKCASEIETLASNRFETFKLYKKLACIIGEIDKGVFRKTKTIKSLSGDDLIRFEKKGKDGFDSHNYAKPLIATNHLPETTDKAKGFYRRWTIVDFPNEFSEKKDILSEIPEKEYNNFCKQSINILKELLKDGEFHNDGTIQNREDNYEKHSNRIGDFVKIYCDVGEECWVPFKEFCEYYNEYLISEGFNKKSKIEIGRAIILKGYEKKIKKVTSGLYSTTQMAILGIKFREDIK